MLSSLANVAFSLDGFFILDGATGLCPITSSFVELPAWEICNTACDPLLWIISASFFRPSIHESSDIDNWLWLAFPMGSTKLCSTITVEKSLLLVFSW